MMTALFHPEAHDVRLLWIRLGTGWLFSALGCAGLLLRQRREKDINQKTTHSGQQH